jgi:hypothetical protein
MGKKRLCTHVLPIGQGILLYKHWEWRTSFARGVVQTIPVGYCTWGLSLEKHSPAEKRKIRTSFNALVDVRESIFKSLQHAKQRDRSETDHDHDLGSSFSTSRTYARHPRCIGNSFKTTIFEQLVPVAGDEHTYLPPKSTIVDQRIGWFKLVSTRIDSTCNHHFRHHRGGYLRRRSLPIASKVPSLPIRWDQIQIGVE